MRDFASEIAAERCWDINTEAVFRARGVPVDDAILQTRAELVGFCEFVERNNVRSYLEVGVWTGRLFLLLNRLFRFEKAAACDLGACRTFGLPFHLDGTHYPVFVGDSHSPEYRAWLSPLERFDLILIDGDHSYPGVRADVATHLPHAERFIALHDICGARHTHGVKRFWNEWDGEKTEIVCPHVEAGSQDPTMGIGIWARQAVKGGTSRTNNPQPPGYRDSD
ncbi:MAG TPA: class I SAM-dependent methyltransferase [Gemmataceae bacterium]|nr:class I SAM-dependent methyltransferase [Gemmataceae bacterium]